MVSYIGITTKYSEEIKQFVELQTNKIFIKLAGSCIIEQCIF